MNVFVDTNVLLDVLGRREPFYSDSARVWSLAATGRITAFISTLSMPNVFYLLCRAEGAEAGWRGLRFLRDVFQLVSLDAQIIHQAMDAGTEDFEDAIQFFSAVRAGATVVVTRNLSGFPRKDIAIHTPAEFLAAHFPP